MEDSLVAEKSVVSTASEADEIGALTSVLALLQRVDADARTRILRSVATFFRIDLPVPSIAHAQAPPHLINANNILPGASFSEDRTISPKQFMLEKQPKTDVEKVACLAYYLTHYQSTPHFKTLDISKLNTEAAQVKFSNPAVAVENASKMNYLVSATKGNKQISALGEQFVQALPDRAKAKEIMANARPRRRSRRPGEQSNEN